MAAVTSAGYFRLRRTELEEREIPPSRPASAGDERLQREAQDEEDPRRHRREDHPRVGRNQSVRVGARLPEALDRLHREREAEKGDKGPGRQPPNDDAQDQDRIRGNHEPAEHRRGPWNPEADDEGPLPDRAVRRDVGDLVNPQNPRDEEPEGEGEDDRREVERAREDEVRPEDRDRPEFDPHRNLPETVMREA